MRRPLATKELVEDRSQGVQLATLRALVAIDDRNDWRKCGAKLNASAVRPRSTVGSTRQVAA
jgi:hypothetical protein